jgi:tryptophan synthase alpha chain
MSRISKKFVSLREQNRAAFIPFLMAGDPDREISQCLLDGLPEAGADLIELGVCFTDPMADGPSIQAAGLRALKAGQNLSITLEMVARFREKDDLTPIILMGYYNPIYAFGVESFLVAAKKAGVDGLIVVDLPPEEDEELCLPAKRQALDFIRLATPTTDEKRLPEIIKNTSGFIYYVSVAGITGGKSGGQADISTSIEMLRNASALPVGVGFGIKTPEQAADMARLADAVIIGSALIETLTKALDEKKNPVDAVLSQAKSLAKAIHSARQ